MADFCNSIAAVTPNPTRVKALLWAWALTHPLYMYAYTFSELPNQIHWLSTIFVFLLSCALFPQYTPLGLVMRRGRGTLALLGWMALYGGGFLLVSFWEVVPGTTIAFGKFELINILVALNAYVIGRATTAQGIRRLHLLIGVLLIAGTLIEFVVAPGLPRFGYGLQLMLCLPAMLLLGRKWLVALGLIVMLASHHRTTLAGALLGCVIVLKFGHMQQVRGNRYLGAVRAFAALAVAGAAVVALAPQMIETVSRFLPNSTEILGVEGSYEDYARISVELKSYSMLPEYWWKGMGFTNFYAYTDLTSDALYETNRFGVQQYATNLHNSYMTWLLEGGPIVASIVLMMFVSTGRRIRWIWKQDRDTGALLLAWCASALLLGWFHQLHASVQFWSILGIVFGYRDQLKAVARAEVNRYRVPQPVAHLAY